MTNDEIYIATMKEQINSGMYDHLFKGRTGLTFLDIGANIGLVSIYAVPYCKRIVAVEPSASTYGRLVNNTRNYSIINTMCMALSDTTGTHEFFENDLNFTASSTVNTYGSRTTVPCITLTKLLQEWNFDHIDVCKIDIEGAEGDALNLSQLGYARDIISTYYIETHNCPRTTWEHKLGTIVGNLARYGYTEMKISGMGVTATKP